MNITPDFDLTAYNTFGLASRARYGARVTTQSEVDDVVSFAQAQGLPLRVIGGGSNLLLHDEIDSVVAVMAIKGREIIAHEDAHVLVTAQAGEDWPRFVEWTVDQGLAGLENLAGIPGTVGAAPVQNIGAYGIELKDRFRSLTAYDLVEKKLVSFDREACGFAYRQSLFKRTGRYLILEVTLALPRDWTPVLDYKGLDDLPATVTARTVMERVLTIRASKLPDWRTLGNAGSFFHNPVVPADVAKEIVDAPRHPQADGRFKLSAAWLIEACGLKGVREGQAGIYEGHALIIVNHGGATFEDVSRLASRISSTVQSRFGVALNQEPITL